MKSLPQRLYLVQFGIHLFMMVFKWYVRRIQRHFYTSRYFVFSSAIQKILYRLYFTVYYHQPTGNCIYQKRLVFKQRRSLFYEYVRKKSKLTDSRTPHTQPLSLNCWHSLIPFFHSKAKSTVNSTHPPT